MNILDFSNKIKEYKSEGLTWNFKGNITLRQKGKLSKIWTKDGACSCNVIVSNV